MILCPLVRIAFTVITAGFLADLIHWPQEFHANNSWVNNHLPLTGKPLLSRKARD